MNTGPTRSACVFSESAKGAVAVRVGHGCEEEEGGGATRREVKFAHLDSATWRWG